MADRTSFMDSHIAHRFTIRYLLALALLAGLTVWGQLFVQGRLDGQQNDAYLLNYAGRQRFQSQQIVKNALLLTAPVENTNRDSLRWSLRKTLDAFETYHYQLQSGYWASLGAAIDSSPAIAKLYAQLEPHFTVMTAEVHNLLAEAQTPAQQRGAVQRLLAHEGQFLTIMDRVVNQYQWEVEQKLHWQRRIEWGLMVATLMLLMGEALLIFRPAVEVLRQTVAKLTSSEQQMRLTNARLVENHLELQATQKKLLQETSRQYDQQLFDQRARLGLLVQGQEEERRRLSRELHDGVGQMLTGLKLLAENIQSADQLTEKDRHTFQNLKTLLVRTIQETRDVSNNLMPPVLSDFGLDSALRQLIEQQSRQTHTAIALDSGVRGLRFTGSVEIGLYRIAQEALHNAIKHASASDVHISLLPNGETISLNVADNGQGFRATQLRAGSHGLHNMRERTQLLNGTFEIRSKPGEGTSVQVLVPIG